MGLDSLVGKDKKITPINAKAETINMRIYILLVIFSILFWAQSTTATETRSPTPLERAYVGFALDQGNHEICRKISPRSLERASFNSPGTRKYYTRSACFLYVAHLTLNSYLCQEVREAKGWFLRSGKYFSRENCENLVKSGNSQRANMGFDHEVILRALGYTEVDLGEQDWLEFYHGFRRRNDGSLQHRIKDLPDFSTDE